MNGNRLQAVLHLENKYSFSNMRIDTNVLRDSVGLSTLLRITNDHGKVINKIKFNNAQRCQRTNSRINAVLGTIEVEFIRGNLTHRIPVDVLGTEQGDVGVIIGRQTSGLLDMQFTHPPEVIDVSSDE